MYRYFTCNSKGEWIQIRMEIYWMILSMLQIFFDTDVRTDYLEPENHYDASNDEYVNVDLGYAKVTMMMKQYRKDGNFE